MNRAERHQLGAVIEEVRAWADTAREVRQVAAHLPVSGTFPLSSDDDALLRSVERMAATGALNEARRVAKAAWFDGRKNLEPAHQAAELVAALHRDVRASAGNARVAALRAGLAVRAGNERENLRRVLTDATRSLFLAQQMRHNAAHLPMTRTRFGALTGEEATTAQSMIQVIDAHHKNAALLLSTSACDTNGCAQAHAS